MSLISKIANEVSLDPQHIAAIIALIQEGNTIPFIARYRKAQTGNASDEDLRALYDVYTYQIQLQERKEAVIRLMKEKEVLTPLLQKRVEEATTLARVEDIYRPFASKRNTRAEKALQQGLEPLAKAIWSLRYTQEDLEKQGQQLCDSLSQKKDTKNELMPPSSMEEALQ